MLIAMALWQFLCDFGNGLKSSLRGFFVIWRLDRPQSASSSTDLSASTVSSTEKAPRVNTVLQQRRLANSPPQRQPEVVVCRRPKAWKRVAQCVMVNLCCVSLLYLMGWIVRFVFSFFTILGHVDTWSAIASKLSVLPLFLASRFLNCLWFADIANASLRYRGLQAVTPVSISRAVADFVMAILLETVFLLQSLLVIYVPLPISQLISYMHLSLLYALYSFEYLWMSRCCELTVRLARVENRWPFYLGFGCPLLIATTISQDFILNGCIFGCLFPFFIISGCMVDDDTLHKRDGIVYPVVHIFAPSLLVTNRISLWLSTVARNSPMKHARPS